MIGKVVWDNRNLGHSFRIVLNRPWHDKLICRRPYIREPYVPFHNRYRFFVSTVSGTTGRNPMKLALIFILTVLAMLRICPANAAPDAQRTSGVRRALIVCGLSGDEEHREMFVESVARIHTALTERFGFDATNIRIQFGRSEDEVELDEFPSAGRATREEIAADAKNLVQQTTAQDTAWVFVIGHSYFDGRTVFLNIPDTDLTHHQFTKLFEKLDGKQSVFFICTPVSGFYIKGLSKPNRIVMTSTEADAETNASIYHASLAKTLGEIKLGTGFDLDKNGTVSLLDLYIRSTQNMADAYLRNDPPLIATEHPQLDDNGDGRGSELQIDYLTVEQGGRSDSKRKRNLRKFKDGKVAAAIPLPFDPGDAE